jgi:hypothetical protein
MPLASCRHGPALGDCPHDAARSCRESLLKGLPYWLQPYKPVPLPPTFKLPYLGGWTPKEGEAAWVRCPLDLERASYRHFTSTERTQTLNARN